jgi:hypothetical protein
VEVDVTGDDAGADVCGEALPSLPEELHADKASAPLRARAAAVRFRKRTAE